MAAPDPADQAKVQQQQQEYMEPNHYKNNAILVSGGYDCSIRYWNVDKGFCERILWLPIEPKKVPHVSKLKQFGVIVMFMLFVMTGQCFCHLTKSRDSRLGGHRKHPSV